MINRINGFTIIEVLITVTVITLLAAIGAIGYHGLQQRTATNTALSDLQNAATVTEQYALKNSGSFPDTAYVTAALTGSKDVNLSIVVTEGDGGPMYANLSDVQNGVLFHVVCNEVINDGFGTGTNIAGGTERWIDFCHPQYGPNQWQLQGWGGQSANTYSVPVTDIFMQDKITTIAYNDTYRPNRGPTERAFWKEFYERFLTRGGKFPVTTFWNPHYGCNIWSCWNPPPYEPLPELPAHNSSGAGLSDKTYCIIATHAKYNAILYSFSSEDLTPKHGNCLTD